MVRPAGIMERDDGEWVEKTVRRPSIRSAEAEERRRGHGVDDAGFWNPLPGSLRTRSRRRRELRLFRRGVYQDAVFFAEDE